MNNELDNMLNTIRQKEEQCHKLEEAGIQYWVTFLNGVAGREHSHEHAVNSAKIFNQLKPFMRKFLLSTTLCICLCAATVGQPSI
jgi:hypothetical protein